MNRPNGDIEGIAARAEELPRQGGALLLRHGPRERIAAASVDSALNAQLTDAGRLLAEQMGTLLPKTCPIRLFHSPVPRCRDTASALALGHRRAGGEAALHGDRAFLAASFVRDENRLMAEISSRGLPEFMRDWVRGDVGDEVVQPAELAARALLGGLYQTWADSRASLDVHISHDIVVLALAAVAWDITADGFPWPPFLDGIVLDFDETTLKASLWFHDETRGVALPQTEG